MATTAEATKTKTAKDQSRCACGLPTQTYFSDPSVLEGIITAGDHTLIYENSILTVCPIIL